MCLNTLLIVGISNEHMPSIKLSKLIDAAVSEWENNCNPASSCAKIWNYKSAIN